MGRRSVSEWGVLLLATVALAVAPSVAQARPQGNVAATQALARATDTLVRVAHPDIARGLAAVKSFDNQIAAQCPRVAAGSPQDHDSEQLSNEVVGGMTAVGYRTAAAPIAAFARAVKGLHWSDGRLTRAVRTFARKLVGLSTLATPNLCGDIAGWVASSYNTLPASTVQFDQRYAATDVTAEEAPLIVQLATPYALPSDVPVLHHVERFEAQLGEAESTAVGYYTNLMSALELNP
jgi:hypothetical protein